MKKAKKVISKKVAVIKKEHINSEEDFVFAKSKIDNKFTSKISKIVEELNIELLIKNVRCGAEVIWYFDRI